MACEQFRQHHLHAQIAADPRNQLHGQQRMPAELEEVVVAADALDAQQFGPDACKRGLHGPDGRLEGACTEGVPIRYGQRTAVQLAVGRQRQAVHVDIGRRHHVLGQRAGQGRAQLGRGHLGAAAVGHQALVAGDIFTSQHHGLAHTGHGQQPRLDLAELDAEAPDLDLVVVATQELDGAVGQPAAQVAGAVHAGTFVPGGQRERVADEALGGQLRPVEIATRHARPADVQLPADTYRNRLTVRVQDVDLRVDDRPADRDASRIGLIERCRIQSIASMAIHGRSPWGRRYSAIETAEPSSARTTTFRSDATGRRAVASPTTEEPGAIPSFSERR